MNDVAQGAGYTPGHEPGKGLAITSLVTGIMGIIGLCAPLGLVALATGIPAWIGASKTPPTRGGKGLAIAGTISGGLSLITGSLGLALVAGIMLPALGAARQAALTTRDAVNVRAIAQGLTLYAQNNNDALPPVDADWRALLIDGGYAPIEVFETPYLNGAATGVHSYVYLPADSITFNARQVLVYTNPQLTPDGGTNVAFHDNHIEFIDAMTFEAMVPAFSLPDGTPFVPHLDEEMP
ncbi:MAG: DUF4190 domain-containing protein [Planctomycetota bacterium]